MWLRDAFGQALVGLAEKHEFVVVDTDAANANGCKEFREQYPRRFFQSGIAEQNAVCVATGFSIVSDIPVFVLGYATFMMRAIEQARLSLAYGRANVKVIATGGGFDGGPDGVSAQGLEDIAAWRVLPDMTVIVPGDCKNVFDATKALLESNGPAYMRTGFGDVPDLPPSGFELGRAEVLRYGRDITIIACGVMVDRALQIADEMPYSVRVVNMHTIKPIDRVMIRSCLEETKGIIVAEEHQMSGGLYSAVCEVAAPLGLGSIRSVSVSDTFAESGTPLELANKYGTSSSDIELAVQEVLGE